MQEGAAVTANWYDREDRFRRMPREFFCRREKGRAKSVQQRGECKSLLHAGAGRRRSLRVFAGQTVHGLSRAVRKLHEPRRKSLARMARQAGIRGIEPSIRGSCKILNVTQFVTLEDAAAAAALYSSVKGYPLEGFACERCGGFHIRADEKKFAEARQRARERAVGIS